MAPTVADWIPCWLGPWGIPHWEISPRMSHRSANRFHERELARACVPRRNPARRIDRVEVDPVTGRISVVIAKPSEVPTGSKRVG